MLTTVTEPQVTVVVEQSAGGPSDAARDPVSRAVAEVAERLGRVVGERIVLDAAAVCDAAMAELVGRVHAHRSPRPLHSLRLEPARLLAVLASREDVPATILTGGAPEQAHQVAESWRREASVSLLTVRGGPVRFVIEGRRLLAEDGGAAV